MENQFELMRDRRFLPLFVTQFLGAFNDNLFKTTISVLVAYKIWDIGGWDPAVMVSFAAGLFILPFLLFAPLAGELADKFDKARIIRIVKLAEIGIALTAVTGIALHSIPVLLLTLFALGSQSAFFSPSKFSIMPQHLKSAELIGGNALLNTGAFLAILLGTIIGGLLAVTHVGLVAMTIVLIVCALAGYAASRYIPEAPPSVPKLKLNFNTPREAVKIIKYAYEQPKGVFEAILGTSWFYFVGGMVLAQFPNWTKQTLGVDNIVLTFFMAVFSIGIAVGGLLNNSMLRSRVEATYVPLAALGMTLFSLDLYFASNVYFGFASELGGLGGFLSTFAGWRITFDLFALAAVGGIYVVPLKSIVQDRTPKDHRARVLAGSNLMDALFILASAVMAAILLSIGFEVRHLFLTLSILSLGAALYICQLLPEALLKTVLQVVFKVLYRVEIRGLENYEKAGDRFLIVGNHVSLLDAPLLAAFLPGKPMFAVNTHVAEWWWVKPWLKLIDAFPLDPTNPFSTKQLIRELEKDKKCVIFPEGRLTETGALMKIYQGPGMIADKAGAKILPIKLDGVQHTPFARLKGKVPLRTFPKITITILEPREFEIDPEIKGRARRAAAGRQLHDVMEEMVFMTQDRHQTLFQGLLQAEHVNGKSAAIVEDIERRPMPFKKLKLGAIVLGARIAGKTEKGEPVGLLLPNSSGAVVTFFALQAAGRVPAMLNFSAGLKNVVSACNTAQVKTVLTSRRFIELGRLDDLAAELARHVKLVYLEDLREEIGLPARFVGLLMSPFAGYFHSRLNIKPSDPGVILFTSGSEGEPKGVVLSHENIMSNVVQLSSRVDFNRQDIVFNCLPMFHSFGLTGGTLLPVLSGVKTFLYPSPLHYRIVPELVYSTNATIMFGTDTFLAGYARMAHPYDFYRMRYIFAGAEKVKEETRQKYMDLFGVRILEGYGATETAPALAVNSAMHYRAGSVGRFLPGVEYRLEDVPGVDEGGRLYVRGPNIMLGYMYPDRPGIINPPDEGWHDTGDIVNVDAEGYVRILGRAKRFAKIAGEMVSLTAVETLVTKVYPDSEHAVVAVPDARKGEQLILVTTNDNAKREDLSSYANDNGIAELSVPKTIIHVDKMFVLGTGKIDYPAVQKFVEENS